MGRVRSRAGVARVGSTKANGAARRVGLVFALSVALILLLAGTVSAVQVSTTIEPTRPTITGISPAYGPVGGGNTVTITGTDFVSVSAVTFGGLSAAYTAINSTTIQATVPAGSGPGTVAVHVTASGFTNDPGDFSNYEYADAPSIEAVEVNSGPVGGGTAVTIYGVNFFHVTGVTFGGTPALSFTVVPESEGTRIEAVAPAHTAGLTTVQVIAGGGPTPQTNNYTYIAPSPSPTPVPVPAGTRFQETDGRFYFSPAWHTVKYWRYSGGAQKYSYAPGASIFIPFRGTRLDMITKVAANLGIASVSVDGGAPVSVDLYSAITTYQKKVWSTGDLVDGLHLVKIVLSGTKNANSTGTAITVDAVDVVGALVWPTRFQENDPGVVLGGSWATKWCRSFSGGKVKSSSVTGSKTTVQFDGARLNLVATKARNYGKAWVSLDGGPAKLVDLYSHSVKYKQTVYSTGFLAPGPHTVIIEVSGSKNAYSKGYSVNVDAFDITGDTGPGPL